MTKHGTTTATASGNLIAGDPKAEAIVSLSIRISELLCYRRNTNQCAAICLQHSSLTPRGKCPERMIVFGDDAKAIAAFTLTELERATAEIARLRDALTNAEKTVRRWHREARAMCDAAINGDCKAVEKIYFDAALGIPFYGADPDPLPSEIALASSSAPGSPVENHER